MWKASWRTSGEVFAVKHVDKASMESLELEEQLVNEISILHRLQHDNILRLKGCFEDSKTIYLVLEMAPDGSLFRKMSRTGMPEDRAIKVRAL